VEQPAPVVSVVIKSYNHEAYVGHTIRSVLEQSFQDFEIVVTDDGSTDATPQIIEAFTDARIRFERSERNRGAAATMNATVARARGEFIAILNSDDFALPGRLKTQVAFLRDHPEIAAVFCIPVQVGESGAPIEGIGPLFAIPFEHPNPTRVQWLRHFFLHGNCLCAPSAMIRRSAYAELGTDDPRLALLLDLDRWIRLLQTYEIHVMAEPLVAFRVRANLANASAPRDDTRLRDTFEAFEIFKRYRDYAPEFLREIFAEDIARHGIDASRPNGVLLAEIALRGSMAWHPAFALDSLFAAASDESDYRRLRELSGSVNAFRIPLIAARAGAEESSGAS
jgi:glycosyltransferase involved in cell wall biosynthesis